jgi:hypothetical protein
LAQVVDHHVDVTIVVDVAEGSAAAGRRQSGYVPPAAFLNAYLGLGNTEEAFIWLGRAAKERSSILQFLKVHPFFDSLRGDPRFAEFLRRANL